MKLRFIIDEVSDLLGALNLASGVKRLASTNSSALSNSALSSNNTLITLCFEEGKLIVSSGIEANGVLVWSQIDWSVLAQESQYVINAKGGVIGLQVSCSSLCSVLSAYQGAQSRGAVLSALTARLQYAPQANLPGSGGPAGRKLFVLALTYEEGSAPAITHHFELPVVLLRPAQASAITAPPPNNIKRTLALDSEVLKLMRRTERHKGFESLDIITSESGELQLSMSNEKKNVTLKWKRPVQSKEYSDAEHNDIVSIRIKPKWWNLAVKMLEMSSTVQLILHQSGCILSSHINDNTDYLILYYIPGVLSI